MAISDPTPEITVDKADSLPAEIEFLSDTTLVSAFVDGDASAFDELFHRYHQKIRALCLRMVSDPATADDMLQETFLNVVRSVKRVDDSFNFSAWVYRIATNACTDELRRRQRRIQRQAESPNSAEEDILLRIADSDLSGQPEEALERQRMRRLIWQVSAKLPERQRTALAARELQGKSYASIARLMNISESAVESLLHRARRRFREEFLLLEGPLEPEGTCAVVERLLMEIGMSGMQADQRELVNAHLPKCSWCRERAQKRS